MEAYVFFAQCRGPPIRCRTIIWNGRGKVCRRKTEQFRELFREEEWENLCWLNVDDVEKNVSGGLWQAALYIDQHAMNVGKVYN